MKWRQFANRSADLTWSLSSWVLFELGTVILDVSDRLASHRFGPAPESIPWWEDAGSLESELQIRRRSDQHTMHLPHEVPPPDLAGLSWPDKVTWDDNYTPILPAPEPDDDDEDIWNV